MAAKSSTEPSKVAYSDQKMLLNNHCKQLRIKGGDILLKL